MSATRTLSVREALAVARNAGFRGPGLVVAVAIAMAESGLRVDARSPVNNREDSRGLWQINTKAHPQYDPDRLTNDPAYNAAAAYQISGGGANWKPWSVFTNGRYQANLGRVSAELAASGIDPGAGSASPGVSYSPASWPNPFDKDGGWVPYLPDPGDIWDQGSAAAGAIGHALFGDWQAFALKALFGIGGVALVVLGLWRGVSPQTRQNIAGVAKVAAV